MFSSPPREKEWVSWLYVVLWTLLIFATVPLARSLSEFVREHWGRETFTSLVLAALVLALGLAALVLVRSRTASKANYFWLGLVGFTYAAYTLHLWNAPEEALHFIEYGVLSILAFRALSHRNRDPSIFIIAALIPIIAGTLDEVIQWFTPRRVFDYRDVGFNAISGCLAQVGLAKGLQPALVRLPVKPSSVRHVCVVLSVELAILGLCLSNTPPWTERLVRLFPRLEYVARKPSAMSEYGYRHRIPGMGIFYSRFTQEELRELGDTRFAQVAPILDEHLDPRTYSDFLREYTPVTDPFLHEIRVHLYRRDHYRSVLWKFRPDTEAFAYHNRVAYRENQFLESFFPRIMAQSRYRLDPDEVERLRQNSLLGREYESAVSRDLITSLSKRQVLGLILLGLFVIGGVWGYSFRMQRKMT